MSTPDPITDNLYLEAKNDSVGFLESRRMVFVKLAKRYHLDPQDLYQEAYEVLLKCLRDFTPEVEKDGEKVTRTFATFFGNRMESCAMTMRNTHPEYQARQAFTDNLSHKDKQQFKNKPELLVQHIDHDGPVGEYLMNEISLEHGAKDDLATRVARDSFFDQVLSHLIADEHDPKKKAALMHIKVGGIYNFQDMAYHFGVSDSRASQVLNELMDAFYTQRLINGDADGVLKDFKKVSFSKKRATAIVQKALDNGFNDSADFLAELTALYPDTKLKTTPHHTAQPHAKPAADSPKKPAPTYVDVLTEAENQLYPVVAVEVRKLKDLTFLDDLPFRSPENKQAFDVFAAEYQLDDGALPAIVSDSGLVIDGARRLRRAKAAGQDSYMCIIRNVADEKTARQLRVIVNMRQITGDKKYETYYAIRAMMNLGFSQQIMADCVGISRPNVAVYTKVHDKAASKIQALFEDKIIKITNASICADLDEALQDKISDFIRKSGSVFAKGEKFNSLIAAATSDHTLSQFIATETGTPSPEITTLHPNSPTTPTQPDPYRSVLEQKVQAYETELKDQEIWGQRREAVITQQTEDLKKAQDEISLLQKELDAAELTKFGTPELIEKELKQLRAFYAVTERLSGASQALKRVSADISKLNLTRSQSLELKTLYDTLDEMHNKVRVALVKEG